MLNIEQKLFTNYFIHSRPKTKREPTTTTKKNLINSKYIKVSQTHNPFLSPRINVKVESDTFRIIVIAELLPKNQKRNLCPNSFNMSISITLS